MNYLVNGIDADAQEMIVTIGGQMHRIDLQKYTSKDAVHKAVLALAPPERKPLPADVCEMIGCSFDQYGKEVEKDDSPSTSGI